MKIALVSPYDFSYPGGVTEHTVALARGLQQRGHDVEVLAACSGYQNAPFPNTRTVTRRVAAVPIRGAVARVGVSPLSYFRIKKIFQHDAFDVIHLQEPLTPSITWWTLLLSKNLAQSVTIGTFHAYHEQPNWFYQHSKPIFRRIFSKLNALIAVSDAAYQFAYQMFPGDYHIIPNGIDLQRFGKKTAPTTPNLTSPDKKVTILFVGRLDKRKGFSTLFEAFLRLKPNYPQLRLQVVGPFTAWDYGPFLQTARTKAVGDIEFVGYVPPAQMPDFYHQADIFCAPSIGFESFGIVLLEAMAARLPIVATDIVGYQATITNGQEGLLVPPANVEALARALSQLLNNPAQRPTMGEQGYLKANRYNWDGIVDKTLQLYVDTLKRKIKPQTIYPLVSNKHSIGHV